jgi:hypothetical protein
MRPPIGKILCAACLGGTPVIGMSYREGFLLYANERLVGLEFAEALRGDSAVKFIIIIHR